MSHLHQKYTGTQYAPTAAALLGALIISPMILLAGQRPIGYATASLTLFCSCLCLGLSWLSWKTSELTIPTLEVPIERAL